jgi:hypothetical protein
MRALIFALGMLATTVHTDWFGTDCQEFAERSVVQPARGVTRVMIIGRRGFIHVEGRPGATEIRATGHACAAIEELLVSILLSSSRSGSTVTIRSSVPKEGDSFFASAPRLDFTVTVPAGMEVDVVDTSGEVIVSNVGNTRVANASRSSMDIHKIHGNLIVRAPSGKITADDVSGDVDVPSDSSGAIKINRVGGSVTIGEHRSNAIEIRNVRRNVVIGSDASGSVAVTDVGGDFNLGAKRAGSVDYARIAGRVSVPDRYRK